jgi:hypothetical protein
VLNYQFNVQECGSDLYCINLWKFWKGV